MAARTTEHRADIIVVQQGDELARCQQSPDCVARNALVLFQLLVADAGSSTARGCYGLAPPSRPDRHPQGTAPSSDRSGSARVQQLHRNCCGVLYSGTTMLMRGAAGWSAACLTSSLRWQSDRRAWSCPGTASHIPFGLCLRTHAGMPAAQLTPERRTAGGVCQLTALLTSSAAASSSSRK